MAPILTSLIFCSRVTIHVLIVTIKAVSIRADCQGDIIYDIIIRLRFTVRTVVYCT